MAKTPKQKFADAKKLADKFKEPATMAVMPSYVAGGNRYVVLGKSQVTTVPKKFEEKLRPKP